MRLVLLSTSGNQAYIFASNRLREAVGASYLVTRSTTDWINQACQEVGGTQLQTSSGNALVTTPTADTARQLIQKVTRRALTEAPGLSITGVSIDIDTETPTSDHIKAVFEEWQRHCGRTASATAARFQRLPIVAACQSTEWPARAWYSDFGPRPDAPESQEPIPQSTEVIAKRQARKDADKRMANLAGKEIPLVDANELLTKDGRPGETGLGPGVPARTGDSEPADRRRARRHQNPVGRAARRNCAPIRNWSAAGSPRYGAG